MADCVDTAVGVDGKRTSTLCRWPKQLGFSDPRYGSVICMLLLCGTYSLFLVKSEVKGVDFDGRDAYALKR